MKKYIVVAPIDPLGHDNNIVMGFLSSDNLVEAYKDKTEIEKLFAEKHYVYRLVEDEQYE